MSTTRLKSASASSNLRCRIATFPQFIERERDARVHRSVYALQNCERLLQQIGGFVVAFLIGKRLPEDGHCVRGFRMNLAVPRLHNVQRLAVELFGSAVISLLELNRAQIDEGVRH